MWKISGVLLWVFMGASHGLGPNSSFLESKVMPLCRGKMDFQILKNIEFEFVVSLGIYSHKIFKPTGIGYMLSPLQGVMATDTISIEHFPMVTNSPLKTYPTYVRSKRKENTPIDDASMLKGFTFLKYLNANKIEQHTGIALFSLDKATSFYASFYSPRFQIPVRGNLGFAIVMDYRTNVLIKVSVKVVPKSETPYTFQIEISRPDKYIFTQIDLGGVVFWNNSPVGLITHPGSGTVVVLKYCDKFLMYENAAKQ